MMSDDDMELRELVARTLEVNGVLNKIRAELRANVFLAFEEQDALSSESSNANKRLSDFLETKEGHQVFCLVREFLQFFHLDFTLAVLEPESNCGNRKLPSSREDLKNEFNLLKCSASQPLLVEFINKHLNAGSSSPKKNSSKIPRPVKSPPFKDGSSHPDKRSSVSLELDEDEELLKELGMSPVSFNGMKNDEKFTIWSDDSHPVNLSPEHARNKTSSEHMRKKTPSPEHSPKKTPSPEHSPKKTPSPSHTPKKTPSPEHTPKKTPSPEHTPKKTPSPELGSSKGVPPLPSISNTSPLPALSISAHIGKAASSDWDELLRMEEKLSSLGFELPAEEDSQDDEGDAKVGKAVRYSYEDDFLSLEQSVEEEDGEVKLSITEEIEGELSLGSFNGSRAEDVVCTTDETVSTIAAAAFDFGEDALLKDDAWGETTDLLKV